MTENLRLFIEKAKYIKLQYNQQSNKSQYLAKTATKKVSIQD